MVIVLSGREMERKRRGREICGRRGHPSARFARASRDPSLPFSSRQPGIGRASREEAAAELSAESLAVPGPVQDVPPTVSAPLGVPVGRDMVGEVTTGVLAPRFWRIIRSASSNLLPAASGWGRARTRRSSEPVRATAGPRLRRIESFGQARDEIPYLVSYPAVVRQSFFFASCLTGQSGRIVEARV